MPPLKDRGCCINIGRCTFIEVYSTHTRDALMDKHGSGHTRTCTHTHTRTHSHTHTHTRTHTHTYTHTHTHMTTQLTNMYTLSHAHIHIQYTHTHTLTHTYSHDCFTHVIQCLISMKAHQYSILNYCRLYKFFNACFSYNLSKLTIAEYLHTPILAHTTLPQINPYTHPHLHTPMLQHTHTSHTLPLKLHAPCSLTPSSST